ncbi:MAG: RNA 2',3'-cyclic phosphodiesterase [Planctomycetes bacterium]|nr:RNA 2',3'-cyclic phosphodiesterase [Planctomycetota bacterium]
MQPLRTFIAVDISPSVASKIGKLVAELRGGPAKVKWTRETNIHLTLQFLGDVEPERTPEIAAAVAEAAAEVEPFEVVYHGIGAFPTLERPRTLWIGVADGREALCELQGRIEAAMTEQGFRPEARQYHPHLTLGRVRHSRPREIAQMLEGREDFHAGSSDVSEAVLYSSELGREGPTYTALARAPLGA